MKLYIKQKVFSWKDKFFVKDEYGQDKYYVEGELFSWGRKLHVYDMNQREVVFIAQKVMTFLPEYHVSQEGLEVAVVKQKFTWFRPKYEIQGPNWTVEGSFWQHEYTVSDQGGSIQVSISKELMSWGDSYELDIAEEKNELLALSVVLAIDCAVAQNSN